MKTISFLFDHPPALPTPHLWRWLRGAIYEDLRFFQHANMTNILAIIVVSVLGTIPICSGMVYSCHA